MASEPTGTQAIDRAAQLLVSVVEATRPPSVGELSTRAGLPKSTTSRLLAALERQGLVQRLGAPSLRRLAEASGETVNLAVPGHAGVEHLAQEDTGHIVGVGSWVGRGVPYHLAANGKCFLAFGAAESNDANASELARVRTRGYATSVDELEHGLSALAAPVFGPAGDAIAALSISGPTARLTSDRIASFAPLLIEEATKLAERLGHRDHARGAA